MNLVKRIISALILIPLVLIVIIKGGILLNLIVLLVAGIAAHEWHKITLPAKRKVMWSILGILYVITPFLSFLFLAETPDFLLLLLVAVWSTDIGGYVIGKTIGGPKLVPQISPQKTWAGFFAGIFFAVLIPILVTRLIGGFPPHGAILGTEYIIAGSLISIVAQLGDLFESWVKRQFGVKDSGSIIPGHGGILDRIDGLMFVLPMAALYVMLAVTGT